MKAPKFITNIDFTDLRTQKTLLLETINNDAVSPEHKEGLEGILAVIDALQDYAVDELKVPEMLVFDFEEEENRDMTSVKKPEQYFKIVHSGYQKDLGREEIQVHGGVNANIFLIKTDEGFVIDVYGQNDLIDTMAIFEDTLNEDVDEESPFDNGDMYEVKITPENFSDVEIAEFKQKWGQTHKDLCEELGYNKKTSDDIIMLDFFWIEKDRKWYNKESSLFTEREQAIANYLRLG